MHINYKECMMMIITDYKQIKNETKRHYFNSK
jgi:hypothetical protein